MTVRIAGALAAIAVVVAAAGSAGAQYYPPGSGPYPSDYQSRPYRAAPPADYDDDDPPDYRQPPPGPYAPQPSYRVDQRGEPYPPRQVYGAHPDDRRFDAPPYDRRYGAPAPRVEEAARPAPEIERRDLRPPGEIGPQSGPAVASLPPDIQPETGEPQELPQQFRRQLVDYQTKEPAGTIVIDTPNTYLYLVLGKGKAVRYGIGVGREGFTWKGRERISRMAEWPDWYPPEDMIERQPYLPRFMAGGPGNPLGARALYLGKTLYRIHGTNQPSTIGKFVSSGCIRLLNADIEDLYGRVQVGTRVVVLPGKQPHAAAKTH
jgi:lipoprotein-anchoring transpeptidase ErfK/SrfK